jgi:hypothetical protein
LMATLSRDHDGKYAPTDKQPRSDEPSPSYDEVAATRRQHTCGDDETESEHRCQYTQFVHLRPVLRAAIVLAVQRRVPARAERRRVIVRRSSLLAGITR